MTILFKKSGFYVVDGKDNAEPLEPDLGTLSHLRDDFEIDADDPPVLQDFVTWLRSLGEDLLFIEMYTGACIRPYLEALGAPVLDDDEPLTSIAVSTQVEIDDYSGSLQGDFEFSHGNSCSGLTSGGERQAIEFTAWEKLLGVKLTLDPHVCVTEITWTPGDGTKPGIVDGRWVSGGRVPTSTSRIYRNPGLTFGDWLQAILGEICWFPDPVTRDREFEVLVDRVKEVKEHPENLVPMGEDFVSRIQGLTTGALDNDGEDLKFNDTGDDDDDLLN